MDYYGRLILLHVTEFHSIKGRSTCHFTLLLWIWTFLKFRYSFPFSLIHVFRFGHCNNCFISKYKVLCTIKCLNVFLFGSYNKTNTCKASEKTCFRSILVKLNNLNCSKFATAFVES